jgi:hypothetical protein
MACPAHRERRDDHDAPSLAGATNHVADLGLRIERRMPTIAVRRLDYDVVGGQGWIGCAHQRIGGSAEVAGEEH